MKILGAAAGWGVAGVLAVAMAAGGAFAATTTTGSESDATTKTVGKDGVGARAALKHWGGRMEHAEAVVKSKQGDKHVLIQRGHVTSIDASSMSVRSDDGWTATWKLDDKTRVRSEGKKSTLSDVKDGELVIVAGAGADHNGTARIIRNPDRDEKKASAS